MKYRRVIRKVWLPESKESSTCFLVQEALKVVKDSESWAMETERMRRRRRKHSGDKEP